MLADDPSAVVKLTVHGILSTERFRLAWTASEPLCVPVVFCHQWSFSKNVRMSCLLDSLSVALWRMYSGIATDNSDSQAWVRTFDLSYGLGENLGANCQHLCAILPGHVTEDQRKHYPWTSHFIGSYRPDHLVQIQTFIKGTEHTGRMECELMGTAHIGMGVCIELTWG